MDQIMAFMKMDQQQKIDKYRILNEMAIKGQILFTGSSLMEQFPINELLVDFDMDYVIYNRGVGGFKTDDMLEHMEEQIFGTEPSRIFINIGTNDISMPDYTLEKLMENYKAILTRIQVCLPEAEVYLMAYYPVNEVDKVPEGEWGKTMFTTRNNQNIQIANAAVEQLAKEMGYRYIDVNKGLSDERGMLKKEYTIEGVHMYANGYRVILQNLKQYL
ncbi:GDSL-type esterase/lipase family protein [Anaerobium acetethylicum]|uniref:Lysophospholipase L1 n=1 Tax=Anaerobium acetethylicum TaxID=1619234 RepID=A0A1D3TVQ1_9FIRM|nr:GDSL-type esterase/lipase family protein [Anaerobium acetethylicum]SCP98223.1 Lysophospholipase L1 [Anaerobium acetethylicum]